MGCGAEGPRGQKGTDTTPSPSAHVGVSPWKLLRSLFIQGIFLSESLGCLLWLWLCVKTCSFLNIDKQRTAPAFLPSWAALSSLEELPGLDDRLPAAALLCTSQCGSCVWQPSLRLNWGPWIWDGEPVALPPLQALAGPPACQLLCGPAPARSLPRGVRTRSPGQGSRSHPDLGGWSDSSVLRRPGHRMAARKALLPMVWPRTEL